MNLYTREQLIAFENRVVQEWEDGNLPSLVHLCNGNEDALIDIFRDIRPQDYIFVSHRAHYHVLLKGMMPDALMSKIERDLSMFLFDKNLRIYQSAILGGCCGIATGVAKAIKDSGVDEHVYVFLGDGAADNGHLYEAAMYSTGHDLPITFIIENNNRQVDTDIATRRGEQYPLFQMQSPKIREYHYTSKYPHAGSGCKTQITFQRTTPL